MNFSVRMETFKPEVSNHSILRCWIVDNKLGDRKYEKPEKKTMRKRQLIMHEECSWDE